MWVEWEQWADNGYGGQIGSVDKGSRQKICAQGWDFEPIGGTSPKAGPH